MKRLQLYSVPSSKLVYNTNKIKYWVAVNADFPAASAIIMVKYIVNITPILKNHLHQSLSAFYKEFLK